MKTLTILLITLLALPSCSIVEEPFEPDWHLNQFRCKINGKEWKPYCVSGPLFGCSATDCQYYWDTKGLEISASYKTSLGAIHQAMRFNARPAPPGQSVPIWSAGYSDYNLPGPTGHYDLDTTFAHHVTILEVDTVNYTIKGTFAFTCIDPEGGRKNKVVISDGYFHLNFRW